MIDKTKSPVLANEDTTEANSEVAAQTKATVKKKKLKRTIPNGRIVINATFNNTIISVSDSSGGVISAASAGAVGFRGSKKGTAYAAQVAVDKAIVAAKQNNGMSRADVIIKGIGQGRDAAIRAIAAQNIQIDSIKDQTSVAHAGCRPRKARRG